MTTPSMNRPSSTLPEEGQPMALGCEALHVFISLHKQIADKEISYMQSFLLPSFKSMLAFPLRGECQSGEISFGPFDRVFQRAAWELLSAGGFAGGAARAAYQVLPAGSTGTAMHNALQQDGLLSLRSCKRCFHCL